MKLKRVTRYKVDFTGKWTTRAGFFLAVALFLRILTCFAFENMKDIGIGELFTVFVLPGTVLLVYGVLLAGFRITSPLYYAVMGSLYCLLLIILAISTASGVVIVISILWYMASAAVLTATALGHLPVKYISAGMFALPPLLWLVMDLNGYLEQKAYVELMNSFAVVCGTTSFACISMSLKNLPLRKKNPVSTMDSGANA